jgi:Uma2 family endonuclease
MALAVNVRTRDGEELCDSYLVRIGGWTEERYFAEAPESQIVEYEDGELIVPSPVSIRHQELVGFLTFLLRGYANSKGLGRVFNGPAVVRLRPDLDYEPDIFVVLQEHLDRLEEQYFSGAPDLVVEVMSPSGRNYDLRTKADHYRRHGVREYWAVDPATNVLYQHLLSTEASAPYLVSEYATGRLESSILSGFWLVVSWLWEVPLPQEKSLLDRLLL